MHYFLVNGVFTGFTATACDAIEATLVAEYGVKVQVVTDPWMDRDNKHADADEVAELKVKLSHMDVRPNEKLNLILDWRERLIKEVIIPAMGEGNIVLYHGGMLNDNQYVDKAQIPFDIVLRENLEMLQSIGGIAYPAGSISVQSDWHKIEDVVVFEERARRLGESCSRFKQLRYSTKTPTHFLEMLIKP